MKFYHLQLPLNPLVVSHRTALASKVKGKIDDRNLAEIRQIMKGTQTIQCGNRAAQERARSGHSHFAGRFSPV